MPSNLRSNSQSPPVPKRSCVSVAAIGSSHSGISSLGIVMVTLPPLGLLQPRRHRLVVIAVTGPPLCRGVPPVVLAGHVDAAVDEITHRLVRIGQEDQVMQDAR